MNKEYPRKFKAFNHPWHLAHQYELAKFPFVDWEYLVQCRRPYSINSRGDFMAGKWVPHYEEGKYDFALLHLDQQCIEDAIYDRGKGSLYRILNEDIKDIPKIVLMHGTPYYPEKFSESEVVEKVREIVGDNAMITNSKRASEQFGFGIPIWHGLDPEEWLDLPKEPRVVTMISPAGLDRYYDRVFLDAIREELQERDIEHCHITVDWRAKNWDEYKEFLGRSLLYLHPCKDSPMPRARTEAMLSGCCVLTTPWQDADSFIEDKKNGFIIGDENTGVPRNPVAVADLIEELLANYRRCIGVGQAGKETAKKIFSIDRYHKQWYDFICNVVDRK